MKKNNSKKWIKTITITTAVLVFAAGAVFALKSAGTANTDKDSADTVVAAANEATDLVVKETVSEKETEVITETAATEATTEEATEAVTEQSRWECKIHSGSSDWIFLFCKRRSGTGRLCKKYRRCVYVQVFLHQ